MRWVPVRFLLCSLVLRVMACFVSKIGLGFGVEGLVQGGVRCLCAPWDSGVSHSGEA